MSVVIKGKVWKFGDDVNTDAIAPAFAKNQPWELAKKSVLYMHRGFTEGFRPGDIIVAGHDFGCGSSREAAPANLKRLQVACVVAESFGRIFLRSSVAIAFPVLICPGVSRAFDEGDQLELDLDESLVKNLTRNTQVPGIPFPRELVRIIEAGGMMQLLRQEASRK